MTGGLREVAPARVAVRSRRITMFGVVTGLFAIGTALALASQFPGGRTLSIALCITAVGLGARHAFDIDHIAAIDTTTRAFLARGTRTESIGFWFALGHSTIVVSAVALLCLGFSAFTAQLDDERSGLYAFAGVWGPAVAGSFLLLAALLNLGPLRRAFAEMRQSSSSPPEAADARGALPGGVLGRALRPALARVSRPWHMYVVGFLFGLGFDTASTIGLLALGGAVVPGAPSWTALALPVLFTAGMVLCDTLDGMLMQRAYAWSRNGRTRRAGYDFTITAVSIVVAVIVGMLSLLDAARSWAGGSAGGALDWLDAVDLSAAGPLVVVLLLAIWGGAVLLRRSAQPRTR